MRVILKVNELSVQYGKLLALDKVSFHVEEQDYLAIVGPNGSGKSTAVKTILGLAEASSGQIQLDGIRREDISYVPQQTTVSDRHFPASVKEVILTGLSPKEQKNRVLIKKRLDEIIKLLDLEELLKQRIGYLSGGQQQRVLLARALISQPKLLILDEPTSALDVSIRADFYAILKQLNQSGVSIVLVSHDLSSVSQYAKHLLYLDQKSIFFGSMADVCESQDLIDHIGEKAVLSLCQVKQHEHFHTH